MTLFNPRLPILADAVVPNRSLLRDALLVLGGSLIVAALAQISVADPTSDPLKPVPITGQTLGVFLVALALGSRLGIAALLAYVLEGAVGLPVFAGFSGGLAKLVGPTGGYIVGFVLAAAAVGWLSDKGWSKFLPLTFAAMLVGTLLIYIPGLVWLNHTLPQLNTFDIGLKPFILGDTIKAILAALLLPGAWKLISRL